MNLSKRERWAAYVTIAVVCVFVLDSYIVTPLLNRRAQTEADKQATLAKMDRTANLFARRKQMGPRWKQMLANGLTSQPSQAESQVLHAVRNWAQESGITLTSVKPEHAVGQGRLREILFLATGTGTMRAVARFLGQVEGTQLPLKVRELQLGSRKKGADDLSVQVRLSALYLSSEPEHAGTLDSSKKTTGGDSP